MNRAAHPLPKTSGHSLGFFISWFLSFTVRTFGDIQSNRRAAFSCVSIIQSCYSKLSSLASVERLVTTV